MADEKTPEQLQQEMFDSAIMAPVDKPGPEPEPPPAPPPEPPAPPAAAEPAEGHVPPWRLREEAEARRVAEDRARQLETRLNEVATHLSQQQKKPDFFDNPEQAAQALILQALQPYAEDRNKVDMYNSQMIAKYVHGAEKVEAAEQAFLRARDEQSLDPVDYERVVQSPNRWDAVVQWHKNRTVLSSVGDDPEAWYQKRREADMNDPKFQAEVMARARANAATRPSETRLPPSLSKSTAATGNRGGSEGDMSDQSLFRYAMDTKRPQ